MKRILFVACAATLFAAGCQKTEIINPVGGEVMTFTTGLNKLTKASGEDPDADSTGTDNLKAQDFRVWAYYVEADEHTGAVANALYDGMGNSPVTYSVDGGEDKWSTDKQYYWPGQGKELRFFAVSADAATHGTAGKVEEGKVTINDDRTTLTITDFVVNHNEPNTDLMVADFIKKSQGTTAAEKSVNLVFRHALSKVEFLFKTDTSLGTDVWVQEVSVSGVKTKSTLTVSEVSDVTTFTWGERSVDQIFYDDYVSDENDEPLPIGLVAAEGVELHEATNAMYLTNEPEKFTTWLVMPQDIKTSGVGGVGGVDLKVNVIYVMGNRQFKASFSLGTDTLTAWAYNQYVKYTITLTPNLISFNPSVEPWTEDGEAATDEDAEDTAMEEERGN